MAKSLKIVNVLCNLNQERFVERLKTPTDRLITPEGRDVVKGLDIGLVSINNREVIAGSVESTLSINH